MLQLFIQLITVPHHQLWDLSEQHLALTGQGKDFGTLLQCQISTVAKQAKHLVSNELRQL